MKKLAVAFALMASALVFLGSTPTSAFQCGIGDLCGNIVIADTRIESASAIIGGDGAEVFLVRNAADSQDLLTVDETGDNVEVGAATLILPSAGTLQWSTDAKLVRDAANTLAQRNGANAQTARIYGTFTDASNYERLALSADGSGSVTLAAETAGTGTDDMDIVLTPAGGGAVVPGADNTYDLGASGTRFQTGYFGTSVVFGSSPASAGTIRFSNDNVIAFRNSEDTTDISTFRLTGSETLYVGADVDVSRIVLGIAGGPDLQIQTDEIGFFGTTPAAQTAAYTQTGTPSRTLDCTALSGDAVTVCNAVQQIIDDLQTYGLFQ